MTHMITPAMLDMFVKWDPLMSGRAAFFSGVDNEAGTIRMSGGGIWRPSDAQRYFDQQHRIIERARARFGPLRVSIDVREWVVENEESVLQFQDFNREMFRAEDRIATVVKTCADKQNSRDALATGIREAFLSPGAAETWLQAYSAAR